MRKKVVAKAKTKTTTRMNSKRPSPRNESGTMSSEFENDL